MPKKRFQPEEVIGKLRHADVLLGQGKKIAEVVSRGSALRTSPTTAGARSSVGFLRVSGTGGCFTC